jgi:uncharacterized MnhB-related membrane protein
MKYLLGKSPISSIAGYLLAGALVVKQLMSACEVRWYYILLAAVVAIAGRLIDDGVFVGTDVKTSIIGYVQFIAVNILDAFTAGAVDWKTLASSLVLAILARLAGDAKPVR